MRRVHLALAIVLALAAAPAAQAAPSGHTVAGDLAFARSQLRSSAGSLAPAAYPWLTSASGGWRTRTAGWWTSGFFPGSLWLAYGDTGDAAWRARAKRWQAGLEAQKDNTTTHDVGFLIMSSFGNGYRYTGAAAYRRVVLAAARSLATRFNPAVGCTRSLGNSSSPVFTVLIDNMMNLQLLFWAARHGGEASWRRMAISHALKTREQFVRPDGSTYHVVDFNSSTGAVRSKHTDQGLSDQSTWSRGQAWALYGFTTAYRETHDSRFLDTARRTADFFVSHLPADKVPYWDFNATGPGQPRDSSAAAIAASGLLELARVERSRARSKSYRAVAGQILDSLSSPAYRATAGASRAILLHGTSNKPDGEQDSGTAYGDYYFIEALQRFRRPTLRLHVAGHGRTVAVKVRANAPGRATASLSRGDVVLAKRALAFRHAGARSVRLRVKGTAGGRVGLRVAFAADNGRRAAARRKVSLGAG
jgi:unsaturated chondroitin disaccharide hydrolase